MNREGLSLERATLVLVSRSAHAWASLFGVLLLLCCGRTAVYGFPEELADAGTPPAPCGGPCGVNAVCRSSGDRNACECLPGFELRDGACRSVAATLEGLRWELPCLSLPTDFPEYICFTKPEVTTSARVSGRGRYALQLRLRGVVETKAYVGAQPLSGTVVKGGTPAQDDWNLYRLEVSSPSQLFHLNAGNSGEYQCVAIDVQFEVVANGGATFTLFASPVDNRLSQIRNRDADGGIIVIPELGPAFDGQFLQMDVLQVRQIP